MRESSSLAAPPVLAASGSDLGRVRTTNEDRVYADTERGCFAVIDGVGGQAAGEHAAQTALDTIRQRMQLQIGTPAERVREAIALANDEIRQQALLHPDRRGMACVLTVVLLQAGQLTAGHVGDTRLYKMHGGLLRKLTHDHSPIGEREDRGELSETEAMRHPRRNEIYREVGIEPRTPDAEGFIDLIEQPFEPDAALLLCSDGLSDSLSSAAITAIIDRHAGDPSTIVQQLITQANEAGGKDNVSVVYIEGTAFASTMRRGAATKGRGRGGKKPLVLSPSTPASSRAIGSASGSSWTTDDGAAAAASAGTIGSDAGDGRKRGSAATEIAASTSASASTPTPATARRAPGTAAPGGAVSATGASASANATSASAATASGGAGKVWMFVVGLLLGVAIALGVGYAMRDMLIPPAATQAAARPAARTLTVGSSTDATYPTIGQAMADAHAGDIIRIESGEYREQVVVTDGVTLQAASPREAVLRAPAAATQPWTAIIIPGTQGSSRVSGLKIVGEAQAPIAIGIHVLGRGVVDDVEVSGAGIAGISLADGAMSVIGASLHDNGGPGIALNGGEARLAHNVFARNGGAVPPGVDIVSTGAPRATFTGNVIDGDPAQRVRGLAADRVAAFREANIILSPRAAAASPPPPRPRAATPRRAAAVPVPNR